MLAKLVTEEFFQVGGGNDAFADDFPGVVAEDDDGGDEVGAEVAGVEYQRDAGAELLHYLRAADAGRMAGDIGAGAGDGAGELVDEAGDDGVARPAQSDASGVAGDFEWQAMSGVDDDGERAGPKMLGESQKIYGDIAREQHALVNGIDQDGQGAGFGAAFDAVDLGHGGEVERVGGKSVDGVGGDGDHAAASQEFSRVTEHVWFRGLRVDAQQFCRQFVAFCDDSKAARSDSLAAIRSGDATIGPEAVQ